MTNPQPRGTFVLFEDVRPRNPPRGSENWPVVDMREVGTVTVFPDTPANPPEVADLSRQIAVQIAAAPPEKRAELQARVNADIARAVAAAGPVA